MIQVRWFRNALEHRNYWLRFGLMRMHRAGQIRYSEYPLASCTDAGFDPATAQHEHKHTSVVAVQDGATTRRCIVDSEDSLFWMSPPLLRYADLYFCSGYNRAFFEEKTFTPLYNWQQQKEVSFYVQRARDLVRDGGELFDRVRPFVPLAPEMHMDRRATFAMRRLRNLDHKISTRIRKSQSWRFEFGDFEARYRQLLALRDAPRLYDVVLLDTLWAWPRHRYALHMRLKELAEAGREIHARLNWSDLVALDGGEDFPVPTQDFPVETGRVGDYERMLASSRLAVFATGLHYGWRMIMTLALMWGLPVRSDRLLMEPWFDLNQFEIGWNEDLDWHRVSAELYGLTSDRIVRIRSHNQAAFDRLLAPEKVADYFIRAATAG